MSKDLTQKLNGSLEDKVDRLIAAVQSIDSRVQSMDSRLVKVEAQIGSLATLLGSLATLLGSLATQLEVVETRLGSVETRLGSVETRLGSVETRLGSVETRLETLEIKVDERLKETRPMWEAVQAQLAELGESQEKGFHRFDRVMDRLSGDINRLHVDQVDLESRVDKIEKR
jgi:chromosome segregation ATPase